MARMKRMVGNQLFVSFIILLLLVLGTMAVIAYGRGYRLDFTKRGPELSKTGILAVKSFPTGAQVFLNDHLTAATDENINLAPGEYRVKVFKEGYFPVEKTVKIEEEVVTSVEALLFPSAPRLESITVSGADGPVIDPSLTKIAYRVSSQSAPRKNGVYIVDMTANPVLLLQGTARQIADDTFDAFSTAELSWSPDGLEIIATVSGELQRTTYALKAQEFNEAPRDITAVLQNEEREWQKDKGLKENTRLRGLKVPLQKMIATHFNILAWSPDNTKILYVATRAAELPLITKPRLIGINNMKETRKIEEGKVYTYDVKEDVNIKILDELKGPCQDPKINCNLPLRWFSDSRHVIYVHDSKIDIMEYDSTNQTTIFAGPFEDHYVFPWPNSSKIVILTNLGNKAITPNLYTIGLR